MTDVYEEMMGASERIAASFPPARFYASCARELSLSRAMFAENSLVSECREIVSRQLGDNFGHGWQHVESVALEAGALALIEGAAISSEDSVTIELGVLAQVAGLLHDVRRGERNHASAGAAAAETILGGLSVPPENRRYVVEAIANHEAFIEPRRMDTVIGQMISDVLYDADKFRWGPDNFTVTLWAMLRFSKVPVDEVIRRFPEGMAGIARIKATFRSGTGRAYGPEFIDLGLKIGQRIYEQFQAGMI